MLLAACVLFGLLIAEPQPGLPDGTFGGDVLTSSTSKTLPIALPASKNPETVLLDLINVERIRVGVSPLKWDPRLAEAAHDHAEIMSQEARLSHHFAGEPELLDRLTRRSVRLDAASENVVYDISAEGAHDAFEKSLPHRTNMLNAAYDGVGISVVNRNGILYVVEDFAHRIVEIDNDVAEQRISDRLAALRQQSGLPPLEFVGDPRVQALVEQMAQQGKPDGHAPLSLQGAKYAASYATTSPDEIPANVANIASLSGAGTCTVGVRFVRTARYPSGLFWVSIVLFDQNVSLARR